MFPSYEEFAARGEEFEKLHVVRDEWVAEIYVIQTKPSAKEGSGSRERLPEEKEMSDVYPFEQHDGRCRGVAVVHAVNPANRGFVRIEEALEADAQFE